MADDDQPAPSPAATLLLVRDRPAFQVLMVERHPDTPFGPGALVFPGGRLHDQDRDPAWGERAGGWAALDPDDRARRLCAIRETFEETAILLAGDGGRARVVSEPEQVRGRVCRGEASFLEVVADEELRLDLQALTPFARWIGPRGLVRRFDASFFIATAPDDQLAACDGFETVSAEWIEPSRALALADVEERKLMYPTRMNLQLLNESRSAGEAIAAARARPLETVSAGRARR